MPQPNILFILSDQQRWDSLGCYGQELPTTPNLDRLAGDGVRFLNGFSCQPVCGPARACLQSGRYASETGCVANGIPLPATEARLAPGLTAAGYEVGYVGKWHLAGRGHECEPVPPEKRAGFSGFWRVADLPEYVSNGEVSVLFDEHGVEHRDHRYRADAYTDHALAFLAQRNAARPFFLFLSYVEPHPQPYHQAYRGPEPSSRERIIRDYMRYDAPPGLSQHFANHRIPGDLAETPGDWQVDGAYADYLASVARVDANVGRLLDWLADEGLAEDTVVVYTADHGCHFRTRNGNDKNTCHDASIRVPFLLHGPGFRGGQVLDDPVSLIDLPRTLLEIAEAPIPVEMRGVDLRQLIRGTAHGRPDSVFVQTSGREPGRAVRTRHWTYAITASPPNTAGTPSVTHYVESHLYDNNEDPDQLANRVADPALDQVRQELRGRLVAWMREIGEPEPMIACPTGDIG
jgi:uncharacterized sulfatase